jgi:hypothetical protein
VEHTQKEVDEECGRVCELLLQAQALKLLQIRKGQTKIKTKPANN